MPADYGILYEEVFGVSPEVSVYVAPNLTVRVRDTLTKKPLEGALVTINTEETTTDTTGLAIFPTLPPGAYRITVSRSGYKGTVKTAIFEVGQLIDVSLWPWWIFGLGGTVGLILGIVVVERWTRPKRG